MNLTEIAVFDFADRSILSIVGFKDGQRDTRSKRSRLCSLLFLPLLLSASAATGEEQPPECAKLDGHIEYLESVKTSFARGEYEGFFQEASRLTETVEISSGQSGSPTEIISEAFPDGFRTCQTILSLRDSPVFISEVVMFIEARGSIIFVAWNAVLIEERWQIINYEVTSNFDVAMSVWR